MTLNVNNNVTINETLGHHTHHCCKPVINRTTGDIYASATDAAEMLGVDIRSVSLACLGKVKSCKGNRLEYLDRTSGNVSSLAAEIRRLYAENEQLKADAKIGRAIREKQEAKRKAEEERNAAIAKLEAKLERRKRIVERVDAEYQNAVRRMMETEKELAELKGDKSK